MSGLPPISSGGKPSKASIKLNGKLQKNMAEELKKSESSSSLLIKPLLDFKTL